MANLKELTWAHHQEAERQEFVKVLMSGKINPQFYATYLWNQHKKYDLLEAIATTHGLLDDLHAIRRKNAIHEDYLELWNNQLPPPIVESTNDYIKHMKTYGSESFLNPSRREGRSWKGKTYYFKIIKQFESLNGSILSVF